MKVSKFNLTSDPFYLVDLLKKSESVVSSFIIEKSNFEENLRKSCFR